MNHLALPITLHAVPSYVAVALMFGLALVLLYLDFQKRANRAFALVLLIRGAALLIGMLRGAATTPEEFEFFQRIIPYFAIPQFGAILYFLVVYPRPRTWLGRSDWGGWLILLATLALEALYALDHSLYYSFAPGPTSSAVLDAGGATLGGYHFTAFGPLVLIGSLGTAMSCVAPLVLARDYLDEKPGGGRYSLVLIIAGFTLGGLFSGVNLVVTFVQALVSDGFPWAPWGWAFAGIPSLTLPLSLAALAFVWFGSQRTRNQQDDREARRLLLVAPIPLICAVILTLGFGEINGSTLAIFTLGIWRLVTPLLVSYALLRYQLFDLDVKARLTIQYGSVVALFGFVFFLASEITEAAVEQLAGGTFGEDAGQWAGLASAGLLTIAIPRLQQASARMAHKLMPSAKRVQEMSAKQRRELYNDQFQMALQDGRLSAKERKMLAALQRRLQLPDPGFRGKKPVPS